MNNELKIKIPYLLIGLFVYLFIGLFLPVANGQSMSNNNYIIKTENLDTVDIDSVQNNETKSLTQKPENIAPSLPFSVSLSSDIVDFGILAPTNPIIRTVDLSVNNIPSYGYSVLAFENNALKNNQTFIPDTTCDSGECGIEISSEWLNPLTFGFGYRCGNVIGTDCDPSFKNANAYKHFSDMTSNSIPYPVMAGIGQGNKQTRISYKVNISGNQTQGIYSNIITYIAVPNF